MPSFSQIILLIAVFGIMTGLVNFAPALVKMLQDYYQAREKKPSRQLENLFVQVKSTHLWVGFGIAGLVVGLFTESWIIGAAVALMGAAAPTLVKTIWQEIRVSQFEGQLLDGLILINNALKSGLDIATGIELVSNSMKPPISEEFSLVLNAYRLGAPLEEALQKMTQRMKSRSLETAVGAIIIQRETGGNLVKTFEQLIITIREESKLQKKIKALSAQGRTQIAFLAFFPWIMAGVMFGMTPETMKPALESSTGQIVLVGLVVWEIIGLIITKRVITVDV